MARSAARLSDSLRRVVASAVVTFAMGACAPIGPDYERPEVAVRETWDFPEASGLHAQPQDLVAWWKAFEDPVLVDLVERAYHQNLSLEVAGLRVLEARARLGIAIGSAYPQSQRAFGGATGIRASESNANTAAGDLSYSQYDLGADVAWELDFWGRFQRGIESADASFLASIADYDEALVLLTSQVADTYAVVRTVEERLRIARENLDLQRRSYEIAEVKYRNGEDSELDMQQALTLLLATEATVPQLQAQLVRARNALATLLGLPTDRISALMGPESRIPTLPAEVAVGMPADLLRRRPDVRRAELNAVAQSHLVGVAEADLYPSIVLRGTVGVSAASGTSTTRTGNSGATELINTDSLTYNGGPQFSWNFLNYGRIRNNIRVQDARLQQLLVSYQQTVLSAAQETEDAMVAFLNGKRQTEILARTVASAKRSSELSVIRYREGFSDYQRVLDAQQALFTQQQRHVDARGENVRNLVALYKALGGGWEVRAGAPFVDDTTRTQMQERTEWGDLLAPAATDPAVTDETGPRRPDW